MWVAWAKLSPFDCLLQFLILMFTLDHPMDSPHNLYWVPVLDWTALLHSILSSASSPSSPSSTSGPLMVWQEAVDRNWCYPTWVQLMLQPTPAKWQSLQLTQEIWSDKSVISHHMTSWSEGEFEIAIVILFDKLSTVQAPYSALTWW